ncbi:MAG: aspartate kinase [Bdellovibrionales bacterium]|nr:aspartate kinase [Bdellovibrionales bacterium]
MITIKKFGGTSVGSIERIEKVADRIVADIKKGQKPVVVASAMSGETNRLVRLAHEIDPLNRGPGYDMLLASGEQVSIALLSIALEKRGVTATPLLAHQLGIQTDSIYSKARIQSVDGEKLKALVNQNTVPIVAGFQGVTDDFKITTLGRGGSDTTAVALAASIGADACEIYTDVPAVFTADPRLVKRAREIPVLCYEEMMEMASLGSKVLHFRCVELAVKFNVKLHVRSTFEEREGTWIVPEGESMENPVVSSVTHDASTVVLKIFPTPSGTGFKSQLFSTLAERGIVVDIITQSHNEEGQRLAFSVSEEDALLAKKIVDEMVGSSARVDIMKDMAKISTIGVGMRNHPGVAARFFQVLDAIRVPIHLVTTSEIKISAVIDKKNLEKAAEGLHREFHLDDDV